MPHILKENCHSILKGFSILSIAVIIGAGPLN
jgi:hypothetical protein